MGLDFSDLKIFGLKALIEPLQIYNDKVSGFVASNRTHCGLILQSQSQGPGCQKWRKSIFIQILLDQFDQRSFTEQQKAAAVKVILRYSGYNLIYVTARSEDASQALES